MSFKISKLKFCIFICHCVDMKLLLPEADYNNILRKKLRLGVCAC